MLIILPLDHVGEVFSGMACCILQIGASVRVNDDSNIEWKRLILASSVFVEKCPACVVMSIRRGFSLPFPPLALSRKGHMSSTTNRTLLSRRD